MDHEPPTSTSTPSRWSVQVRPRFGRALRGPGIGASQTELAGGCQPAKPAPMMMTSRFGHVACLPCWLFDAAAAAACGRNVVVAVHPRVSERADPSLWCRLGSGRSFCQLQAVCQEDLADSAARTHKDRSLCPRSSHWIVIRMREHLILVRHTGARTCGTRPAVSARRCLLPATVRRPTGSRKTEKDTKAGLARPRHSWRGKSSAEKNVSWSARYGDPGSSGGCAAGVRRPGADDAWCERGHGVIDGISEAALASEQDRPTAWRSCSPGVCPSTSVPNRSSMWMAGWPSANREDVELVAGSGAVASQPG